MPNGCVVPVTRYQVIRADKPESGRSPVIAKFSLGAEDASKGERNAQRKLGGTGQWK
jgi:hypothetical protein